jgi:hypothetical protein
LVFRRASESALLPIILSYPEGGKWWRRQLPQPTFQDQAPVVVLVLSAVTGIFWNGGFGISCTGASLVRNFLSRVLDDTLRGRLTALDHAHGLVRTRSTSSGGRRGFASLKEFVAALLWPYEGAGDKHFIIDGDEVFVDGGIVTPQFDQVWCLE